MAATRSWRRILRRLGAPIPMRAIAAAPAADWPEAVEKARYLLGLLARNLDAADLRRRKLIERVLADFDHLLDKPSRD